MNCLPLVLSQCKCIFYTTIYKLNFSSIYTLLQKNFKFYFIILVLILNCLVVVSVFFEIIAYQLIITRICSSFYRGCYTIGGLIPMSGGPIPGLITGMGPEVMFMTAPGDIPGRKIGGPGREGRDW